jgi:hypothetical protein
VAQVALAQGARNNAQPPAQKITLGEMREPAFAAGRAIRHLAFLALYLKSRVPYY